MDSPPRATIETPCLKVCAVNGMTNQCIGCGRTLAEIGGWTRFTDAERRAIMDALPARMARARLTTP